MSQVKEYLIQKNIEILSRLEKDTFFKYNESDALDNLLFEFKKRIPEKILFNVLVDLSITFEHLRYSKDHESNHEDLIEAGYLLGLIHATHKGCIYSVEFSKTRFYFVGYENDILLSIRNSLKQYKR
jgi:uncharacterized protein with ParB-like and HNH nuclease domain